jgi:hypothetical protein
MPWTKVFPKNTEVDVILTFASDGGGSGRGGGGGPAQGPPQVGAPIPGGGGFGGGMFSGTVGSVTPTPDAVTLREHHTFAELPDGNYTPRIDDTRAGYGALQYDDYAAPLGTPMVQRFVRRHRPEESRSVRAGQRREEADCVLRRSRNARADPQAPCSKAPGGGTRRSRRQAIAMRFASSCCPKGRIPWTSVTT